MNESDNSLHLLLPHSYPFVLIDRVEEIEEGKRVVCIKNISHDEDLFCGHFPANPVFPAVYIIEAMAQTSGLLIGGKGQRSAYLSMIRDVRFYKHVRPGDRLTITSSLFHEFQPFFAFEAKTEVEGEVVAEAGITLSLT